MDARGHVAVSAPHSSKSEDRGMQTGRVVSIVDDDEAVCIATSSLVRALGWQASIFTSAEAFLQSTDIAKTDCLITDVCMPGMSGVDMHARLLDLGFVLPTVFITAFPTAALRAKVMANGALAVLEKPIDVTAIAKCLDQISGNP